MLLIVLVFLGLVLGSFVNALVWRLRQKKNWLTDRSECEHCHHKLAPVDLVPVISWLWLRGKCRYCHKPIKDSPLVELALPILFVASYYFWPIPLASEGLYLFIFWLVFLVGFATLAIYDLKWFLLPNKIVFPLIGLAIIQVLGQVIWFDGSVREILGAALGVLVISGLFYFFFAVSKGKWIGFGDVKLGVVLGILAGGPLPALLVVFLASVIGMLYSLPQISMGKLKAKGHVPFGPFLIAATIIVVLFGADIISWYRNLLYI